MHRYVNMKNIPLLAVFLLLGLQLHGQLITGKVLNSSTGDPLVYASIGVKETARGTITNEQGDFSLDIKDLPANSDIRFSMIGFKPQTISLGELRKDENIIRLEDQTYNLSEIIVKPSGRLRKVGIIGFSKLGYCGWTGTDYGPGHEIGTKIELGDTPVKLKSFNLRVKDQSFDSVIFRLRIRKIVDSLPGPELLKNDILFHISEKSGWVNIDLSKFDLVFNGDIAITIEWIKIMGMNKPLLVVSGKFKGYAPSFLFNVKRNRGCSYGKRGIEDKWVRYEDSSPSFYLTVQ
jgi:hypothetical protein